MSIFMDYEGVIGESADSNHKRWIDIEKIDWGTQRRIT
ncbi:MAG: type VI secretion system tube protein Hcp [Aquisalimonadaceae bacterium]